MWMNTININKELPRPWALMGLTHGTPDSASPQRATASRHCRAQAIALWREKTKARELTKLT